ncbi:MAG: prepilin-type N-terminal cleavage/methylation domain-containing protein [Kiritimatiellae bacterium]|nr:prepilin-type N-terminal cleavage/methylation domain-containing protein [Kiritimatiellia bacterium]
MKQPKTKNRKSEISFGFTLMEMLIVISIISILLSLLYGALERAQKFSRRAMTYTELKNIQSAFKQYFSHYSVWPDTTHVTASMRLTSDEDVGFIIDGSMARILQGVRDGSNAAQMDQINPACIPLLEFARYSRESRHPVNPFKSLNAIAADTTRSYRVLFDTNGDGQITIPGSDADAVAAGIQQTNIITSVAVWTMIPATRTSSAEGAPLVVTDVILGSWDSFTAR